MTRSTIIRTGSLIRFDYVNWHKVRHSYEVHVESIEYGAYDEELGATDPNAPKTWVLHGWVNKRDGSLRPSMGEWRRRSFIMRAIENPEVIR